MPSGPAEVAPLDPATPPDNGPTDDGSNLDGAFATTTDASASPSASPSSEVSLYDLSNDPLLSTVLYSHPQRMASEIASDGAVGVNATWEAGQSSTWYIEQQRYGADYVQAGLVVGDAALSQLGWKVLDWGFAREAADGSFPGTGDAFHSTSMWVEAAARALLLEKQANSPDFADLAARDLPRIEASARWLMQADVAAQGQRFDAPYTHRRWLLAAALGQVAALSGDPATAAAARSYAVAGLSLMTADGMNPEKGGGDASYQAYGILLAERYYAVCGDPELRLQVRGIITRGLDWEQGAINGSGQVSIDGSTRTGQELSRNGTPKSIDYKTIIQAFSFASTITGDLAYRDIARLVATGRGWRVN